MPITYCRHILTTGRRCGCPALRAKPYCFFHARLLVRHQMPEPQSAEVILHPVRANSLGQAQPMPVIAPRPLILDFPPLEDRESIAVAASMIVTALGRNLLEPRRASAMLFGLQTAVSVTTFDKGREGAYYVQTDTITGEDGAELAYDNLPAELADQEDGEDDGEQAEGNPASFEGDEVRWR